MIVSFFRQTFTLTLICLWVFTNGEAFGDTAAELATLKQELRSLRAAYEQRIGELESKIKAVEHMQEALKEEAKSSFVIPAKTGQSSNPNIFNPAIGIVLNGRYSNFSDARSDFRGFAVGEEGKRGKEGLSLDETEIHGSASIDDKFSGSVTASLIRDDGEDKVELEEAFVQTQPGVGLPAGLTAKFGRALWTFGYLNEHHTHTDDFADRPLPLRAFLNNAFNDDGIQLSYVLPTDIYSEVGGGIFRGDDFPFGSADGGGIKAWSGYARIGGDFGDDQNWRIGGYYLGGDVENRTTSAGAIAFEGDTQLYATDLRYAWAPSGRPRLQELALQGEYMWRNEDGNYLDGSAKRGLSQFDQGASGFYVQAVYKFLPQWRVGGRYSLLLAPDAPAGLLQSSLDSDGHDPWAYAIMIDWTNSEFSRFRLQYNREELARGAADNQFVFQYIMSLGAHGAHDY